MSDADVRVAGNLTKDPELRFAASGMPVCNMGIAVNYRGKKGEDETSFLSLVVFGDQAENAASLKKGQRVVAAGRLRVRTYEKRDGSTGVEVEVLVDELGASLRWATATVEKQEKSGKRDAGASEYKAGEEPF